ncbi:DUF4405 domain-containing protein [candidate division KSB1 bacterium]|nr:DUF4405 domain-containing protein [candidate division KSB1 bacterium]
MKKSDLNFIIDAMLLLVLSAIIGIGFLLKYVLLTGQQKWEKLGANPDQTFLLLDRHQWGTVHLILGLVMAGLLILHLYFHWCQIKVMYKCLVKRVKTRQRVAVPFLIGCLFLILYPFFVTPTIHEAKQGGGHGKHAVGLSNRQTAGRAEQSAFAGFTADNRSISEKSPTADTDMVEEFDANDHQHEKHRSLDIRGSMTVEQVCSAHNISLQELCSRLGIETLVPANGRMSIFKRQYGISMSTVEKAILDFKNNNPL